MNRIIVILIIAAILMAAVVCAPMLVAQLLVAPAAFVALRRSFVPSAGARRGGSLPRAARVGCPSLPPEMERRPLGRRPAG